MLLAIAALVVSLAVVAVALGTRQDGPVENIGLVAEPSEVTRTAVVQLVEDGKSVRAELGERIALGRDVVDEGTTAKTGVMQALEETLSTARSHYRAPVPDVPPPDADVRTLVEAREKSADWVNDLTWITEELTQNIRRATAAQETDREAPGHEGSEPARQAEVPGREPPEPSRGE